MNPPTSPKGILIVTQAMDEQDANLGFFVTWVRRLSEQCGRPVHVLCWKKGRLTDMPSNVEVAALPSGALNRSFALWSWSWRHRRDVRSVFVHMVPDVVAVCGWWWRLLGWKIILWYTHGTVSWSLRIASWFTHEILTASPESCRLDTPKKIVVGHGIDLDLYKPDGSPREPLLLTVGRVTPRKDLLSFVDLCARIHASDPSLRFQALIVGDTRNEADKEYAEQVRHAIMNKELDQIVQLEGPRLGQDLIRLYSQAALFVSTSLTGSLDKVVLEALACEARVLAVGQAYRPLSPVRLSERPWDDASVAFTVRSIRDPQSDPSGRTAVRGIADLSKLIRHLCASLTI